MMYSSGARNFVIGCQASGMSIMASMACFRSPPEVVSTAATRASQCGGGSSADEMPDELPGDMPVRGRMFGEPVQRRLTAGEAFGKAVGP